MCPCVGHRADRNPPNDRLRNGGSRRRRRRAKPHFVPGARSRVVRRPPLLERSRGSLERVPLRTRLPRVDRHRTGTASLEDAERAQRHHRGDQAREHPQAPARRARPRPPSAALRGSSGGHALGERGASRRRASARASQVRQRRNPGIRGPGMPILLVASPVVVRAPRALRPVMRSRRGRDAAVRSRTERPRAAPRRVRRNGLAHLPVVVAVVADIRPVVPVRHRGTRGRRRPARSAVDSAAALIIYSWTGRKKV